MKTKRLIGALAAAAAIALAGPAHAFVAGAPSGNYKDPGITDKEIVIGLHAPLSGRLKAFGYDALYAAKMWYDEVNARGGIWGRKIRVIIADDKCDPTELVAVQKKFVSVDKVFLLQGGSCTHSAVAAQEFVTRNKVPYVMLNASGDGAVFPPTRYVFGAFGGTQLTVGGTIADFAVRALKGKRIAIIAHDDDYGAANTAAAIWTIKKRGATVATVERISRRIVDVTAPVLKIRASRPDVLVITAYTGPAALIVKKAYELGLRVPIAAAVQAVPNPAAFAKNVGNPAALKNFYYGSPLNDLTRGPRQKWVLDMYKKHYPDRKPTAFMAYGIPSAQAVVYALMLAGPNPTRESFIDAMSTLHFNTGILAGPIELGKNKRDAHNASIFVRFDGKTHTRMPGVYFNEYRGQK
jgi:branched-chain amino acid transport system substrate-binding protein